MNNKVVCNLKLFATNGAGVKNGKIQSLNAEIRSTMANIVMIQETHCTQKGKIPMDNHFVVFEAIRKKKGGGTLLAIHEDLNPKLIEEYNDEFELLVVEINTKERTIRIITGYGPQECWDEAKRIPFFLALETEIEKAELGGKSVIIEMDANAKLGPKFIPGDPHAITPNGEILAAIVERHNLIVANGSKECSGIITRKRVTKHRTEQSVIDFVLFSTDMKKHFENMHVDEERKHVLTRITKSKKGIKVKESDHNVVIAQFNCSMLDVGDKENIEVFNLKNKVCQQRFKEFTSNTSILSSCISDKGDINEVINRFIKKLDGCIATNFEKRRVNKDKNIKDDNLYEQMRVLKDKTDKDSIAQLAKVVDAIAELAENNFKRVKDELSKIKPDEGKLSQRELWKLKKKLCPKSIDPQCAMNDANGNLLTSDKAIQKRALEVYNERLKGNNIEPRLKDLEDDTNTLCELRLKLCKSNKTDQWSMEDLKEVLKHLKKDKSRDPEGYANELFKEDVAGSDLLEALLKLMNLIKNKQQYPEVLEKCNITSLHKKKSKKDFENYRGIFRVQILRSILDRLVYNDSYYTIDSNLTDGNVGARKLRSARDNIFVIGAITNSVVNGKSAPIQVQVMDAIKCFDKLWLQDCINSLYEAGLDNDQLNLLYIENNNAQIAVKVNGKLSTRINVKDVIMQGSIWGSLK